MTLTFGRFLFYLGISVIIFFMLLGIALYALGGVIEQFDKLCVNAGYDYRIMQLNEINKSQMYCCTRVHLDNTCNWVAKPEVNDI